LCDTAQTISHLGSHIQTEEERIRKLEDKPKANWQTEAKKDKILENTEKGIFFKQTHKKLFYVFIYRVVKR